MNLAYYKCQAGIAEHGWKGKCILGSKHESDHQDRNGRRWPRVVKGFKHGAYQSAKYHLFTAAKHRAKFKLLRFEITLDDIKIPEFCPLLGIRLCSGTGVVSDSSPQLDRLRPELGYIPGNVAVISKRANSIKQDASAEELELIAANLRKLL